MIATDHAPHTLAEKADTHNPPPGVPGLESSLPLMLTAVAQGRLSLERLVDLMHANPGGIYGIPEQADTWIEVDLEAKYTFPRRELYTKCGWSPFSGMDMQGRIARVVLHGREVARDGIIHDIEKVQ
jgi:carbamoyl-phosphate synthase/aspartate carbamoyltransferase/dihydroorotase